eukprot:363181-Chlamydomonas_euryale.AAC.16
MVDGERSALSKYKHVDRHGLLNVFLKKLRNSCAAVAWAPMSIMTAVTVCHDSSPIISHDQVVIIERRTP